MATAPLNSRGTDSGSDVLIVGAGVIGLACAWRIANEGAEVTLLDAGPPGQGASRVAAGMLAPVGEAAYGEESLLELTLEASRTYPGFIAELEGATSKSAGLVECGSLHVALDGDEAAELRRRHDYLDYLGLEVEWLTPSRCRDLEPGLASAFHGGLRVEQEAAVDPRMLTAALADAARSTHQRGGGYVGEMIGLEAVAPLLEGGRLRGVQLEDGRELLADHVIDAAGCTSGLAAWLPEEARAPVRPVKGQVVELGPNRPGEPGGPLAATAGGEPVISMIVGTGRVYLVPRRDGRIVLGATVEELGFDTTVTAGGVHELLREAYRAVPEIAEMELLEATAGLRPGTPDNLPIIGSGALEGLIHATGHFRNGILLADLTANAVADLVAGRQPPASLAAAGPGRLTAEAGGLSAGDREQPESRATGMAVPSLGHPSGSPGGTV